MKISKMIRIMIAVIVTLSIISFTSLFLLFGGIKEKGQVIERQAQFRDLAIKLTNSSNFLTNEIRSYVQFGEKKYIDSYMKELNETRTKETVIEDLKAMNAPEEIIISLEKALYNYDSLAKLDSTAITAVEANNLDKARELVYGGTYTTGKMLYDTALSEFDDALNVYTANMLKEVSDKVENYLFTTIISIVTIVLAMIISFYILQNKLKPLQRLTKIADRVSEGDLTEKIQYKKSKDEVAQLAGAVNNMIESLQNLVQQINVSSEQVAASSEELSASSEQGGYATQEVTATIQQLTLGADEQVQSIEKTVEIIDQILANNEMINSNSETAIRISMEASSKVSEGSTSIKMSVQQMNSIHNAVKDLAIVLDTLNQQSSQIGHIVDVITGISEQTNLLALNAAIEAARAGEHGKGFAVVANEVRKLAEQSRLSASQIAQLINNVQQETDKAVQVMDDTTIEVEKGLESVYSAGKSFKQIHEVVKEITNQVNQNSDAVHQMSLGTEQVVQSIELVMKVANETLAGTQSISASSEEQLASMEEITVSATSLSKMADELRMLIGRFRLQ